MPSSSQHNSMGIVYMVNLQIHRIDINSFLASITISLNCMLYLPLSSSVLLTFSFCHINNSSINRLGSVPPANQY